MSETNLLLKLRKEAPGKPLTAAERIACKTWDVFISRSQIISPQYAELIGVAANSPLIEATAQHAAINTTLPITTLAEVYAIGGTPFFRNVKDTVEIYNDVCNYLMTFKETYETGYFPLNVTLKMRENVMKLENFAEWVFGIAKPHFPDDSINPANSLSTRIGRGAFTRELFKRKIPERYTSGIPKETGPDIVHDRISDSTLEKIYEKENQPKRVATNSQGWR